MEPKPITETTKKKIIEWEKTNQDHIAVYLAKGDWWKMGDNSAHMFVGGEYMNRLGMNCRLRVDTDFGAKFKDGIVSFRDLDRFKKGMVGLGCKVEKETENTLTLLLPRKFSKTELEAARVQQKKDMAELSKIVMPRNICPDLYHKLTLMHKDILQIAEGLKTKGKRLVYYDFFGKAMHDEMWNAVMAYMETSSMETMSVEEMLDVVDRGIHRTLQYIQQLARMGLILPSRAMGIGKQVLELERVLKGQRRKEARDANAQSGDATTKETAKGEATRKAARTARRAKTGKDESEQDAAAGLADGPAVQGVSRGKKEKTGDK